MIEVNFESFIKAIINVCKDYPILREVITAESSISVSYHKGSVAHIWIHGFTTTDTEHRVAYEKNYRKKIWELNHYVWKNGRGWTYVDTLNSNIFSQIKLANLN